MVDPYKLTMGILIGSSAYVNCIVDHSDGSPLHLLNKGFNSHNFSIKRTSINFLISAYGLCRETHTLLTRITAYRLTKLAKVYTMCQNDVTDFPGESYTLATLGIHEGRSALCRPLDAINTAFVASVILGLDELQSVYPDIKEFLRTDDLCC